MYWYDKAEDDLCEQLDEGEITETEFNSEMRSLRDEVKAGAEEAADNAYNDYMNRY